MDRQFSVESPYVWIKDIYHPHYPNYVQIVEVLDDGYMARVKTYESPLLFFREDQLSDDLIG